MAHRKPEIDKVCANCVETFTCQHGLKKYCSDECIFEAANKRSLAYYYKNHKPPKTKALKCPYCKIRFESAYWNKIYCCPEHKTLAERQRKRTPEYRAKREEEYIKYTLNAIEKEKKGWTVADRRKYGSKYYFEVIKPRLQREKEAEALMEVPNKIPYAKLQNLSPEHIERYWGRII